MAAQVSAGNSGNSPHPFVILLPVLKTPFHYCTEYQEQTAKSLDECNTTQQRQMRIHSKPGSHKVPLPPLTVG